MCVVSAACLRNGECVLAGWLAGSDGRQRWGDHHHRRLKSLCSPSRPDDTMSRFVRRGESRTTVAQSRSRSADAAAFSSEPPPPGASSERPLSSSSSGRERAHYHQDHPPPAAHIRRANTDSFVQFVPSVEKERIAPE